MRRDVSPAHVRGNGWLAARSLLALTALLALWLLPLPARGQSPPIFYVSVDGSDETGDGSAGRPWATLTHAASAIPDSGSVVVVRDGVYPQRTRIARRFSSLATFRAEHPYRARLASADNDQRVIALFGAKNIVLEGFEITRPSPLATGALLVQVQRSGDDFAEDITLRNNIFHDSYNNDLLKVNNGARNIVIEGNLFYNQQGSDEHIDINGVTDVVVQDNIFFNDFAGSGRVNRNDTASFVLVKNSASLPESGRVRVRRNVFLNWEGSPGSYFVLVGEDGKPFHEAEDVVVENNLMIGNSPNRIRSAFGVKGGKDITFRNNTVVGDLPANAFAMRLNREGENPVNQDIRFYNNIWSDPTGTMDDFSDGEPGETSGEELDNNLYWNGGQAIPADGGVLNRTDDPRALVTNPQLAVAEEIVLPRWIGAGFPSGRRSIREEFERLVLLYAMPPLDSAAVDRSDASRAPGDDILGRLRKEQPDLGAFEVQPPPRAASVVDAAAFGSLLSAGSLATLYGEHLSDATLGASTVPLPRLLASVSVRFGGEGAPLLYVSPTQINFQIPYEAPPEAVLTVSRSERTGESFPYRLQRTAPGIFTVADGQPAVLHSLTSELVDSGHPARPGEFISIFCSGLGNLAGDVETGVGAAEAVCANANVMVLFDGTAVEPAYAGLAIGFPGLYQVNVAIPASVSGPVDLQLQADGVLSNSLPLAVGP